MSDVHFRYCFINTYGCTRQAAPAIIITNDGAVLCGHCQDPVEGDGINGTPPGPIIIERLAFTCVGDAVEWTHADEVLHLCGLREALGVAEDALDLGVLLHHQTLAATS